MPGITSPTTTLGAAPIVGTRTGWPGFCNRFQNLCLALALWNGRDPFLKERLFGLANEEGNHGEDVKEYYYYLDGVPSHAFMRMLYKYPQVEYPYQRLVDESRRRTRRDREFELIDAMGEALAAGRYFDVVVDYAKADQDDILCRITAYNRGPEPAELHILPHAWYRNTWSWGYGTERPALWADGRAVVRTAHRHLGDRWWYLDDRPQVRRSCSPRTRLTGAGSSASRTTVRSSRTRSMRR